MRSFLVLIIALASSGCTLIREPAPPRIETSAAYLGRRLDDPGLMAFVRVLNPNKPSDRWDLDSLTLAALYANPALASARTTREVAKAGEITAGQRPNPAVSVSPGYDGTKSLPWLFGLSANLPIETAGKRLRRIKQAGHLARAADYQIAATAWQIRSHVLGALIDLHAARLVNTVFGQQAAALKAVLDVLDARAAQGQLPVTLASQTRFSYEQALLSEKNADQQIAGAKARLVGAVGVPVTALAGVTIDTGALERGPTAPPLALDTALSRHNDLLASLAEYEAAQSALQLELAKQIPDINIGPGYEWDQDGSKFALGLSVTLPVFNNNEGHIAEAIARRKLAADAFNALQADIISKTEIAHANFEAAQKKLTLADLMVKTLEERRAQLRTRLSTGEPSRLPLLIAEADLYPGLIAEIEARAQLLSARAALEDALQQPLFGAAFGGALAKSSERASLP